jgi:hypothetical protein
MAREYLNLDQLLADPLVRQVMSSDGVDEAQLRKLAKCVSARRQGQMKPRGDQGAHHAW